MTEDIKITTIAPEYFTKNTGNQYEFYLSGAIESADNYIAWFDVIRNARQDDTIKIYINSPGGDLYTARQFLRVMGECEGHLVTSVEGACMSAATMIFLSGHEFQVTPHSLFMFHNYSGGVFGKGGEQYDQIQYERAWSEKFMNEVYKDFLTTEEITSMLNNKDIWMTSEQVLERIEKVMKKLQDEQQAVEANSQSTGQ
jgi:ATP-dependent protease ClpP protease subunit